MEETLTEGFLWGAWIMSLGRERRQQCVWGDPGPASIGSGLGQTCVASEHPPLPFSAEWLCPA